MEQLVSIFFLSLQPGGRHKNVKNGKNDLLSFALWKEPQRFCSRISLAGNGVSGRCEQHTAPRASITCHTHNFSRRVHDAQKVIEAFCWMQSCAFFESHSIPSMCHRTLLDPQLFPHFSTFFRVPLPRCFSRRWLHPLPLCKESNALADWLIHSHTIMMSVSGSLKLRHYDISRANFQGIAQRLVCIRLPAEVRQKIWRKQSWQTDQEHVWNPRCFSHLATWQVTLICGELEGSEEANTVQHCSTSQTKMRGKHCTVTTLRVCQTMMDSHTHRQTSQIQIHSKRHGNTWILKFRREKPSVVEPCVWSWDRSNWTVLGH